ncbi:MAG: exodeoxyribonuclease III [Chitinophagales bacterium]|nr:exodeoxyribonuclease III [Chitinophagales bacterium]
MIKDIISYNVNGIRSAINKGLVDWLKAKQPDVLCLQEVKAEREQVNLLPFEEMGYQVFWQSASRKKGYSGVAVFTKVKPDNVVYGCNIDCYDEEGRVLQLDFGEITLLNTYFPSGSSGDIRQAFKMQFLDDYYQYYLQLQQTRPKLIICGDYNICHEAIDIHNPKANVKTSGFLPEERAWMSKFFNSGMIDTFRHINKDPHHYTWWSTRVNARANNKGWRIDYISVSEPLRESIVTAQIYPDAVHSDHCPVYVSLDLNTANA